ncbi:MAG TPA: peptidoglycan DD-metalloendopeptidase family protein [Methylomirabilota bacterium]|nr:peptidoglycan DD-metalloendopeptidase family protein [Methylomirabilota bacterium]
MRRSFVIVVLAVMAAGAGTLGYIFRLRLIATSELQRQEQLAIEAAAETRRRMILPTENAMPARENFAAALQKFGLSPQESAGASAAAQTVFNLRQVRAGNTITVGRSVDGELRLIEYRIDAERKLRIVPAAPGFAAEVRSVELRNVVAAVSGSVEDSLFNGVQGAGEAPELAVRLAQIFGYDLDFYTDTRRGDTFRIIVEKKQYKGGKLAAYGRILAAEYDNGNRGYTALLFHDAEGKPAYYSADGKSLQKAFLRSPLKFAAHVTSHFSNTRFHPILKTTRPHLGVDYAAPVGTPVQTIGSGRVVFAGAKGGEGNMVHVAHANGYETMYLHLSRLSVRAGQHVSIGDTIGLVGSTGLSTGPHLDFRFLERGKYKNFEHLGLPPADPVSKRNLPEFQAVREKWLPLLKNPGLLQALDTSAAAPGAPARGGH